MNPDQQMQTVPIPVVNPNAGRVANQSKADERLAKMRANLVTATEGMRVQIEQNNAKLQEFAQINDNLKRQYLAALQEIKDIDDIYAPEPISAEVETGSDDNKETVKQVPQRDVSNGGAQEYATVPR